MPHSRHYARGHAQLLTQKSYNFTPRPMNPYHAIIVLLIIVCNIVATGRHGYNRAKNEVIADMNQALAKTLAQKQEAWITPDTIVDYRSHLRIGFLRQSSVIYYAIDEKQSGLQSRKMAWRNKNGKSVEFRSYANCSFASVLAMSDQRPTAALSLAAVLWAAFSMYYFRRQHKGMIVVGGLAMDVARNRFTTLRNVPVGLTPMQQQLLEMLFRAENHQLSKQLICEKLWPKKPDASDTLYTLIRRIKPILAGNGLTITTARGKDYRLERLS